MRRNSAGTVASVALALGVGTAVATGLGTALAHADGTDSTTGAEQGRSASQASAGPRVRPPSGARSAHSSSAGSEGRAKRAGDKLNSTTSSVAPKPAGALDPAAGGTLPSAPVDAANAAALAATRKELTAQPRAAAAAAPTPTAMYQKFVYDPLHSAVQNWIGSSGGRASAHSSTPSPDRW